MSVDYDAILMVGEKFSCKHDAKQFIMDNVEFTDEELEHIEREDINNFLDCDDKYGFKIDMTNYYTDDSCTIVGFQIDGGDPQKTINEINEAVSKWQKIFKKYPKVISKCKVW